MFSGFALVSVPIMGILAVIVLLIIFVVVGVLVFNKK